MQKAIHGDGEVEVSLDEARRIFATEQQGECWVKIRRRAVPRTGISMRVGQWGIPEVEDRQPARERRRLLEPFLDSGQEGDA